MTRISFFVILMGLFLALVGVNFVFANEVNSHESEIQKGKELVESEASCDQLTNEQLEAIGEYLMEQMHPGESHIAVHQMMGMEEGTEYHKVFHINLAKTMYCGQNGMPMTQMMPMMQMLAPYGTEGSRTGMMAVGGFWQWIIAVTFLVWLVVGVFAAIWLYKQITKKK